MATLYNILLLASLFTQSLVDSLYNKYSFIGLAYAATQPLLAAYITNILLLAIAYGIVIYSTSIGWLT